jgi:uncharacterized protein with GYD domain
MPTDISLMQSAQKGNESVTEVPDKQATARLALSVGMPGNVRAKTLRALREEEYKKAVGSPP